MDRVELFDKLLKHLYDNNDSFWQIKNTSEEYFNVTNEKLIESIVDELIDNDWVLQKNYTNYSLMINYNGQQIIKEYGSYSSFLRSENKIKNKSTAEKRVKLILSIIASIGVIWGMFFTYLNYQKNDTIDNQENEIKRLNLVIGSLENELKESKETDTIP